MVSQAEEGAQGDTTRKNDIVRCDVPREAVAVCVVLLAVVITGMTALLAPRWYAGPQKLEQSSVCSTAGCQRLASEILGRLDQNVDPCADIEAHVCGPIRWNSELVTDTATDMMRLWQSNGAAYLERKKKPEGAFALYRACMDPGRDSLGHLVSFMRERGLKWPKYGSMGKHALYVLLDLLINWGVPFWFEMSLWKLPNQTRYSLYVNRVQMKKWRRQQQISAHQGRLTQYALLFYEVFGASRDDRSHIKRLLDIEKEMHEIIESPNLEFVLFTLADVHSNIARVECYSTLAVNHRGAHRRESVRRSTITVIKVEFQLTHQYMPNITTKMWLNYLNELMSPHQFQPDDYVLSDDITLSATMNSLFGRYSNQDLLYALGWWFAQQFAVIASLDGGIASYGSSALALTNRPMDCYMLAESRFRRELFLDRARASMSAAGMQLAEEMLEKIRNTTIGLLKSTPWLDEEARKESTAIVAATKFEAWKRGLGRDLKGQISGEDIIELSSATVDESSFTEAPQAVEVRRTLAIGHKAALGSPLVVVRTSFPVAPRDRSGVAAHEGSVENRDEHLSWPSHRAGVKGWIELAKAYKIRTPNWPRDDSLQHRHLSYSQLAHYEYWWNSLFLQMAVFAEPLFYDDVSLSAASYGGLGSVVAKHLVKAFDFKRGTRLDAQRNIRSWISGPSLLSYERKIACTGGNNRLLNNVAALEMAFAAAFGPMTVARNNDTMASDGSPNWLPGQSQDYSPQMVFFILYCRATCGSTALGCRDVLRHMVHFGRVFRCPANSSMTSAPKCSFFGE